MQTPNRAAFIPPDYLLYVQGNSLVARRMDLRSLRLGDPIRVADGVNAIALGRAAFSASANGVLVYRSGWIPPRALAWYSREGKRLDGLTEPLMFGQFRISPDGRRAAIELPQSARGARNIWTLDFETRILTPVTFGSGLRDADPVWSPDSRRIAYIEIPIAGKRRLKMVTPGENTARVIHETSDPIWLHDWSPDGRLLIGQVQSNGAVFSLPSTGGDQRSTILDTPFQKDVFHFSPDGKWLAYSSSESGIYQVYVSAFPSITGKRQISAGGGCAPMWRSDGRELFYMTLRGDLVAVPVNPGPAFGKPEILFHGDSDLSVMKIASRLRRTAESSWSWIRRRSTAPRRYTSS